MIRPYTRILESVVVQSEKLGAALALCPAHEDRSNASLSVREGHDGRVLLKCFAGCKSSEIVEALGLQMRDLYPWTPGKAASPRKPRATAAKLRAAYRQSVLGIISRRPATECDAPLSASEKNRARALAAFGFRDLTLQPVAPQAWEGHQPWDRDPLWPAWFAEELHLVMIDRWCALHPDARAGEVDPNGPTSADHRDAARRAAQKLQAWSGRSTSTTTSRRLPISA